MSMEWVVVGVIAFLIFGPSRLPELAKGIGKSIGVFKNALKEPHEEVAVKEEKK